MSGCSDGQGLCSWGSRWGKVRGAGGTRLQVELDEVNVIGVAGKVLACCEGVARRNSRLP